MPIVEPRRHVFPRGGSMPGIILIVNHKFSLPMNTAYEATHDTNIPRQKLCDKQVYKVQAMTSQMSTQLLPIETPTNGGMKGRSEQTTSY